MIALYQPLSSLTLCFFQAVLLGAVLGLVYDLLHTAETCPTWQTALRDALFWLITLAAYFVFTVTLSGGQVRGFVLIGMLAGAVGAHVLLGGIVRTVTRMVCTLLRRLARGIVRLIRIFIRPVCSLGRLVQKNLEKIAKKTSISDKKKL